MSSELIVELCGDTGCGLYMTEVAGAQYRISLMPDECLDARDLCDDHAKLREFLLGIEPSFGAAMDALGMDAVAKTIREKPLPAILQRLAAKR